MKISVFDQIYAKDDEKQCVEVFCELVGESACRRSQIVSSQIDAAAAKVRSKCLPRTHSRLFCSVID